MGLLDRALNKAVPQGNSSKPLKIALGALLASGASVFFVDFGRHSLAQHDADIHALLTGVVSVVAIFDSVFTRNRVQLFEIEAAIFSTNLLI